MKTLNKLGVAKKTGKKTIRLVKRDHKVISPSLTREYCLAFDRAKGSYVWDIDGRKYLDFAAGVAVMNTGYSRPEVSRAINKQLEKGTHCGFSDYFAEAPVEFCETLIELMPKPLNKVFLSNSGTEAVEAAYKNKFSPAKQGENPVAVWISYNVNFRLEDKADKEKQLKKKQSEEG